MLRNLVLLVLFVMLAPSCGHPQKVDQQGLDGEDSKNEMCDRAAEGLKEVAFEFDMGSCGEAYIMGREEDAEWDESNGLNITVESVQLMEAEGGICAWRVTGTYELERGEFILHLTLPLSKEYLATLDKETQPHFPNTNCGVGPNFLEPGGGTFDIFTAVEGSPEMFDLSELDLSISRYETREGGGYESYPVRHCPITTK